MPEDHGAELDAIAAEPEAAGLLTIETRADGGVRYRLTQEGARVARQMALSSEADRDALPREGSAIAIWPFVMMV